MAKGNFSFNVALYFFVKYYWSESFIFWWETTFFESIWEFNLFWFCNYLNKRSIRRQY